MHVITDVAMHVITDVRRSATHPPGISGDVWSVSDRWYCRHDHSQPWYGVAWRGVAWCSTWRGVAQHGVAWYGVAPPRVVEWCGAAWYGPAWSDVACKSVLVCMHVLYVCRVFLLHACASVCLHVCVQCHAVRSRQYQPWRCAVHFHACALIHMCTCADARAHALARVRAYVFTCAHAHVCVRACLCARMHGLVCPQACIQPSAYMCACSGKAHSGQYLNCTPKIVAIAEPDPGKFRGDIIVMVALAKKNIQNTTSLWATLEGIRGVQQSAPRGRMC